MSRVTRAVAILVLTVLGCGLLGLAWLGTYSRYVADDFCTTAALHRIGFLQSQLYWYKSWSGRFAFTFVITALESIGPYVARVLPAAVIALLAASSFFAVAPIPMNRVLAGALASAMTWSIVGCAPDVFQDVFWATGVVTYTLPLALIALWAGLTLRNKTAYPLLFFAAAFSETLTVVMGGVAVITFVGFPSQRRKTLPAIAAIALGALIVVLAPGNAVRAAHFRREMSLGIFALIAVDAVTFLWPEFTQATSALALVFILAALQILTDLPATVGGGAAMVRIRSLPPRSNRHVCARATPIAASNACGADRRQCVLRLGNCRSRDAAHPSLDRLMCNRRRADRVTNRRNQRHAHDRHQRNSFRARMGSHGCRFASTAGQILRRDSGAPDGRRSRLPHALARALGQPLCR